MRAAARDFMSVVQEAVPECPDKTVALRAIRDAMMQANAAIACNQPQDSWTAPLAGVEVR